MTENELKSMTVEDALGRDLETILAEKLTRPRGLADTTYFPRGDQTNRLTRACAGHLPWFVRRRHEVPDHRLGDALRATGGLFSSVSDCLTFFRSCWPLVDAYIKDRPLESYPDEAVYGLLRVHVQMGNDMVKGKQEQRPCPKADNRRQKSHFPHRRTALHRRDQKAPD